MVLKKKKLFCPAGSVGGGFRMQSDHHEYYLYYSLHNMIGKLVTVRTSTCMLNNFFFTQQGVFLLLSSAIDICCVVTSEILHFRV